MRISKHSLSAIAALACLCILASSRAVLGGEVIDLSGRWDIALDRKDVGVAENWFERSFAEKISLPGILESQGYGDEISTTTPWVLSLYDHYWFDRADY